jgi:hypothetical protein
MTDATPHPIDLHQAPAMEKLARRLLWIAFCWNDHNFGDAHILARREAEACGIKSFEQANEWLAAPIAPAAGSEQSVPASPHADYDQGFSNGWDAGFAHQKSKDDFLHGICVALSCVVSMDCGVTWAEIVRTAGLEDLLQFAAFVEPEEWELAGFAKYAMAELRRGKPRTRRVAPAPPVDAASGEPIDAQIERLIEGSDGRWHDGEFRIDGQDLTKLLRAAAAPVASRAGSEPVAQDLAMMIRQLVSALRRARPCSPQNLDYRAINLLRKHGLQGSPLRSDEQTNPNRTPEAAALLRYNPADGRAMEAHSSGRYVCAKSAQAALDILAAEVESLKLAYQVSETAGRNLFQSAQEATEKWMEARAEVERLTGEVDRLNAGWQQANLDALKAALPDVDAVMRLANAFEAEAVYATQTGNLDRVRAAREALRSALTRNPSGMGE